MISGIFLAKPLTKLVMTVVLVAQPPERVRPEAVDSVYPSLTMEWARKVAAAKNILDSLEKADSSFKMSGSDMNMRLGRDSRNEIIDNYTKQLSGVPIVVAVLKKVGITPKEYSSGYIRISTAWSINKAIKMLKDQGIPESLMSGMSTLNPADQEFVTRNLEDLKKTGFKEPPDPKISAG